MLQDLVLTATNDAFKKAEELTNQYNGTIHKRNESSRNVLGGYYLCIILNQYRN